MISFLFGPALLLAYQLYEANCQLSASDCGSAYTCIRSPAQCTSGNDCNYLVKYKQGTGDKLDIEMSVKGSNVQWFALGFNAVPRMDGARGDICSLPDNSIKGFQNNGYTPIFTASSSTLMGISTVNGALICSFRRSVKTPVDLTRPWTLIIAYGHRVINGVPRKHTVTFGLGMHTLAVQPRTPGDPVAPSSSSTTSQLSPTPLPSSTQQPSTTPQLTSTPSQLTSSPQPSPTPQPSTSIQPSPSIPPSSTTLFVNATTNATGGGNHGDQSSTSGFLTVILVAINVILMTTMANV